jgi:hypothetical protein
LDFLGFSRPNPYLSMGYTVFSLEFFPCRFSPALEAPERDPPILAWGSTDSLMEQA